MKVLIRREDGSWAEPAVSGHQSEDALQQLLATAPDLLPGTETGLPLAVAREFPVSSGRIDILGVDVDGEITLCECKLPTNPGIRREVVGQLLEYASVLQGMGRDDFATRFEARTGTPLLDAIGQLAGEGFDPESFDQSYLATGAYVCQPLLLGRFRSAISAPKTRGSSISTLPSRRYASSSLLTFRNTLFAEIEVDITTKDGQHVHAELGSVVELRRGKAIHARDYFLDPTVEEKIWGRVADAEAA